MSNHTPGPWTVEVRNDWVNSYDQLPLVCEVDDLVIVAKDGMIGSNGGDARIIAAAPEMLEALKGIAEKRSDFKTDYDYAQWVVSVAKEIIAKAEGDV